MYIYVAVQNMHEFMIFLIVHHVANARRCASLICLNENDASAKLRCLSGMIDLFFFSVYVLQKWKTWHFWFRCIFCEKKTLWISICLTQKNASKFSMQLPMQMHKNIDWMEMCRRPKWFIVNHKTHWLKKKESDGEWVTQTIAQLIVGLDWSITCISRSNGKETRNCWALLFVLDSILSGFRFEIPEVYQLYVNTSPQRSNLTNNGNSDHAGKYIGDSNDKNNYKQVTQMWHKNSK